MNIPYFLSDGTPMRESHDDENRHYGIAHGRGILPDTREAFQNALANLEAQESARVFAVSDYSPLEPYPAGHDLKESKPVGECLELVCECNDSTGLRCVETAIAEREVHLTLCRNAEKLRDCTRTARAVEVAR